MIPPIAVNPTSSLEALLDVFWLRPETALWRELDIRAMKSFDFNSHSLDIGCGDGLFSFIRAGGRFDPGFDAFRAMTGLDRFFDNVDVFDAFDGQVNPVVAELPEYRIGCGFDHKKNLLNKAGQLGLYASLKQGTPINNCLSLTRASIPFFQILFIGLTIPSLRLLK